MTQVKSNREQFFTRFIGLMFVAFFVISPIILMGVVSNYQNKKEDSILRKGLLVNFSSISYEKLNDMLAPINSKKSEEKALADSGLDSIIATDWNAKCSSFEYNDQDCVIVDNLDPSIIAEKYKNYGYQYLYREG